MARVADAVSAPGVAVSWLALVLIGTALVLVCAGSAAALGRPGTGEPGSVVASMAVVSVLGLMILLLPRDLAAYDVSESWNDATASWAVLGAAGTAALIWGAADPWRRRFGQRRNATHHRGLGALAIAALHPLADQAHSARISKRTRR